MTYIVFFHSAMAKLLFILGRTFSHFKTARVLYVYSIVYSESYLDSTSFNNSWVCMSVIILARLSTTGWWNALSLICRINLQCESPYARFHIMFLTYMWVWFLFSDGIFWLKEMLFPIWPNYNENFPLFTSSSLMCVVCLYVLLCTKDSVLWSSYLYTCVYACIVILERTYPIYTWEYCFNSLRLKRLSYGDKAVFFRFTNDLLFVRQQPPQWSGIIMHMHKTISIILCIALDIIHNIWRLVQGWKYVLPYRRRITYI